VAAVQFVGLALGAKNVATMLLRLLDRAGPLVPRAARDDGGGADDEADELKPYAAALAEEALLLICIFATEL
jgi:hypothetical protein